jgi:hypothetical protein
MDTSLLLRVVMVDGDTHLSKITGWYTLSMCILLHVNFTSEKLKKTNTGRPDICRYLAGAAAHKKLRLGGSWLQARQCKKLARPHLNQWLGVVVWVCHPRYAGSTNGKIVAQARLG